MTFSFLRKFARVVARAGRAFARGISRMLDVAVEVVQAIRRIERRYPRARAWLKKRGAIQRAIHFLERVAGLWKGMDPETRKFARRLRRELRARRVGHLPALPR